jgi:hypothetical protein
MSFPQFYSYYFLDTDTGLVVHSLFITDEKMWKSKSYVGIKKLCYNNFYQFRTN